jgi:aspartyl-tRNA(Asn)/glutamyl-tRNA(Gln) amidotransferase subunit C
MSGGSGGSGYSVDSKVDKETVRKVSDIARITLSEDEVAEFSKDMEAILDDFRDIQKMDTAKVKPKGRKDAGNADVKPTFQPLETKNVMRDDEIEVSLSHVDALKNAQQKEKGYFKGPRAV